MVVTPEQYADARHALKGIELHPFHLVVAEQFDYLIEEVLADFPYKRRPRVKDGTAGRQELCVTPESPQMESVADDIAEEGTSCEEPAETPGRSETSVRSPAFVEMRTFLCEAPVLKSDASVSCHSTTACRWGTLPQPLWLPQRLQSPPVCMKLRLDLNGQSQYFIRDVN
mmetsp:Transcript_26601/g.74295  ORF Transcript_26601/g.74295 Transcript_26601/m.74295 type:complete len:170 (+) Transcript_26601:1337-1846(+)